MPPRYQELKEPLRVNFVIEKRQEKALKELSETTNRSMSELIRMAIDCFIETEYKNVEKPIKGQVLEVIRMLKYMKLQIEKEKEFSFEIKREDISALFSPEWWKLRSVILTTTSALNMKGVEALYEEVIERIEVRGTNRTKLNKKGFIVFIPEGISKDELQAIIDGIEEDAKKYGRIIAKEFDNEESRENEEVNEGENSKEESEVSEEEEQYYNDGNN